MVKKPIFKFMGLIRWFPLVFLIVQPEVPGNFEATILSHPASEFQPRLIPQPGEIKFKEEVVYSETDEVIFGNIMTSATDLSGRVFMGDNDQKMIHVFSPDGSYLRSFGKQGNGPGEFQMISKIAVDDSYIHAFDMMMGRINIFNIHDFTYIRTVLLSDNGATIRRGSADNTRMGRPTDFHLITDGSYLVSFMQMMNTRTRQTAIISPAGEILEINRFKLPSRVDEISENSSGGMRRVINFPFLRSTGLTHSGGGILFVNWSEDLEFSLFDEAGNHIRTFSHPHQNAPLIRSELLRLYENRPIQGGVGMGAFSGGDAGGRPSMDQILRETELPETWPAVQNMFADIKNRLWVSSFTRNPDERKWYVFDVSGGLLGTFFWPASRSIIYAGDNYVYVLDRPVDDFDTVTLYRFTCDDCTH